MKNKSIKPIERIGDHLLVCDFNHAEELGIELQTGDYEKLKSYHMDLSPDGYLLLNTASPYYTILEEAFKAWNKYSLEHLIKIYKDLDTKYPDVTDISDMSKYKNEKEKAEVLQKVTLKVELLKRERNLSSLKILLEMLLH